MLNFLFIYCYLRKASNSQAQNSVTSSAAIMGYLVKIGEFNPHPS